MIQEGSNLSIPGCSFISHGTCMAPIVDKYDWFDRDSCPIEFRDQKIYFMSLFFYLVIGNQYLLLFWHKKYKLFLTLTQCHGENVHYASVLYEVRDREDTQQSLNKVVWDISFKYI